MGPWFYFGPRADVREGMITPFCDGCGKPISANQNFCINCGRTLQPIYQQPSLRPARTTTPPPPAPQTYPSEPREIPIQEPQPVFTLPSEPAMPQPTPLASEAEIRRPTGVSALAILMFLGGAVDIATAALLLFLGAVTIPTLVLLPGIQLVGTLLLVFAIFPLIFAMFSFVLGFGLWTGRSWAWTWTFISSIIGLVVSAAGLIVGFGLVGVVVYAIFIFYLTRGSVKSYFGKGISPAGTKPIVTESISEYEQATQPEATPTREMKKISKKATIGSQNRNRKVAGALFLVAWIQSIYFTSIAEGLYPNYNLQLNLVSDLGVQPQSAILWIASVLVTGILLIIAGLALSDFGKTHRELLVTFALTGVGLLGVGAFNENAFYNVNLAFSLLAFAFGAISALIVSLRLVKGLFRYLSLMFGIVMLIGMVLLYAGFFVAPIASIVFGLGKGFAERIIVLLESVWFIAFGAYLIGMSVAPSENY